MGRQNSTLLGRNYSIYWNKLDSLVVLLTTPLRVNLGAILVWEYWKYVIKYVILSIKVFGLFPPEADRHGMFIEHTKKTPTMHIVDVFYVNY